MIISWTLWITAKNDLIFASSVTQQHYMKVNMESSYIVQGGVGVETRHYNNGNTEDNDKAISGDVCDWPE